MLLGIGCSIALSHLAASSSVENSEKTNTVNPWLTWVWTVWVHLNMDFFQDIYIGTFLGDLWQFENTFLFLACFIVRIEYVIHKTCKIGINQLYIINKASCQQ